MTRTKVEKYIMSVLSKDVMQIMGTFESETELKSLKAKKEAMQNAGFDPDKNIAVLTDTVCGVYEMDDDFFFAHATRKQ